MSASLDKHQSGMQYLNMRKATLAWPLMCLLVAGSLLPAHALRVGILQQQSDTVSKGRHNLDELAAAMTEWGHRVDVLTVDQQTPFWEAGVTLEQDLHPTHEALFVQGELSTQGMTLISARQQLLVHLSSRWAPAHARQHDVPWVLCLECSGGCGCSLGHTCGTLHA